MNKKTIIKIGLIVVITLTAFFWGISFLKGKKLFTNDKIFYIKYENINGLQLSDPVLINGFKVGMVTGIKFNEDNSGSLIVQLLVENNFEIPKNSVAKLVSRDIMGSKGIEIELNKAEQKEKEANI